MCSCKLLRAAMFTCLVIHGRHSVWLPVGTGACSGIQCGVLSAAVRAARQQHVLLPAPPVFVSAVFSLGPCIEHVSHACTAMCGAFHCCWGWLTHAGLLHVMSMAFWYRWGHTITHTGLFAAALALWVRVISTCFWWFGTV